MKKEYKYHYVYRITNIVTKYYYYGSKSCNEEPKENIGKKYFSTSSNKLFIQYQKNNPQDYKYKVIKIFETCREDATDLEVILHRTFDVKNHIKFINKSNQTSKRLIYNKSPFHNKSEYDKKIITDKMVLTRKENGSYKSGGKKSITTRMTTYDEFGKSILENSLIKAKQTKLMLYGDVLFNNPEKIKNTIANRSYQEKMIIKNKLTHIRLKKDKNGESIMDKLTMKAMEKDTPDNRKKRIAKARETKLKNGIYHNQGKENIKTKLENKTIFIYKVYNPKDELVFKGIISDLQNWCNEKNGSWYAFDESAKNNGTKLYQFKGSKKFRHFKDYYCIRSR